MDIIIGGLLLVGAGVSLNLFYYLGLNYFFLTFISICVVWYGLAKLAGLKGREIFWYLDYLSKSISAIFFLVVVAPLCGGFISKFIKGFESPKSGLLKGTMIEQPTLTFIVLTILMTLSIALILGLLGKNHKPQALIDEELEEKLSNLSTDELKEIKDNLEAENDKLRAKKEEKLREIVDEFIGEQKEKDISEIEKLKAENEALKKQLETKEKE